MSSGERRSYNLQKVFGRPGLFVSGRSAIKEVQCDPCRAPPALYRSKGDADALDGSRTSRAAVTLRRVHSAFAVERKVASRCQSVDNHEVGERSDGEPLGMGKDHDALEQNDEARRFGRRAKCELSPRVDGFGGIEQPVVEKKSLRADSRDKS